VDESWFGILEFMCYVACETEVRILIDCAGDEGGDIGFRAEDLGEGV